MNGPFRYRPFWPYTMYKSIKSNSFVIILVFRLSNHLPGSEQSFSKQLCVSWGLTDWSQLSASFRYFWCIQWTSRVCFPVPHETEHCNYKICHKTENFWSIIYQTNNCVQIYSVLYQAVYRYTVNIKSAPKKKVSK